MASVLHEQTDRIITTTINRPDAMNADKAGPEGGPSAARAMTASGSKVTGR